MIEGTWAALATLTQHEWGARAAAAHPGFCERVLDRAPMYSKEAKEWKYDAVCNVVAMFGGLEDLISSDLRTRLWQYKEDGPFAASQQEGPVAATLGVG